MTPPNILAETIKQVVKILKSPGCRKTPVFVKSSETAVELSQVFAKERSALTSFFIFLLLTGAVYSLCPIFQVSNVTGEGLDYVRTFLNLLPSSEGDDEKFASDQPLEVSISPLSTFPTTTKLRTVLDYGSLVCPVC